MDLFEIFMGLMALIILALVGFIVIVAPILILPFGFLLLLLIMA